MRIAIGEFSHETNTFCAGLTEVGQFRRKRWLRGREIVEVHRGVQDYLGGMITGGKTNGIDLVPTFATTTEPSATIASAAFEEIRDTLLREIAAAGELDAICLALHGAGSAEGVDDIEGAVLRDLREAVGPDLPIVVTLDLHGHTTPAMVEHASVLLYCHNYPHTDMFDRGREAVELASRIVRGEIAPVTHVEWLPMILPPSTTMHGPGRAINERCFEWESTAGVIDCAFAHGFPHTDVPLMGASIVVTTDGDTELAREAALDVADLVWATRHDFLQELPSAAKAVDEALASNRWPVVIAEVSDNPGGGAPGDGTHLLRELLARDLAGTCFGFIADPETAAAAHRAGVGATIEIGLGGRTDQLHGEPIVCTAYVKTLTDGRFRHTTPMGAGAQVDLGPMARLIIGNVDVLVSTVRTQTLDAEVFLLHGIDVTRYQIVGLKSHQHFRAGFEPIAGTIIRCDPPGLTTSNLGQLPFQRVPRPIWPLDDGVERR